MKAISNIKQRYANYQSLDAADKKMFWKEALVNNAMYIMMIIAVIYTYTQNNRFLTVGSIVNVLSRYKCLNTYMT